MTNRFNFNFINKTIEGSEKSINRANRCIEPEYSELCAKMAAQPTFSVVISTKKAASNKSERVNKLTLTQMKEYIETKEDSELKLIEFEAVKKVAEIKGSKYLLTKAWFLKTYPEFKMTEIKSEETKALEEKARKEAEARKKAEEALNDIELTEEDYEEDFEDSDEEEITSDETENNIAA